MGEGGPLAGEGAGGVEKGGSVEGESWGGARPKYQHPSMRYAGRVWCTGWGERRGRQKQQGEKGKKKTPSAHHKARKTTLEQTQHTSPDSMKAQTHFRLTSTRT